MASSAPDFSSVPGHIFHDVENLAKTGDTTGNPKQTFQSEERALAQDASQTEGENQYNKWVFENHPQEYLESRPINFLVRGAHKIIDEAANRGIENEPTALQKETKPVIQGMADTAASTLQIPPSDESSKPMGGGITPEHFDFDEIPGHEMESPATPTTKEIVHIPPRTFIDKVSKGRVHSDTVNAYRAKIRAGEDVGSSSIVFDEHGNIINANGRHRALAHMQEGTERMPVEIHRPITGNAPPKPHVADAVKEAGGVYRGKNSAGLVEITLPRALTQDLPIQDRFKDFVSVTLPEAHVTPTAVREAMARKVQEMSSSGGLKQ
jgi:hypothetical protein